MGRPPGRCRPIPTWPSGWCSAGPGEDPGGTGARLLAEVRSRGWPAGYLGADRGYTQALPERFHLPVRAFGYSLVMDYKVTELGRQANSQGAVMVDGAFYCPALPEDARHRELSTNAPAPSTKRPSLTASRLANSGAWCAKKAPTPTATNVFACPAQGEHPHLACPLRPEAAAKALGKVPVLSPPDGPAQDLHPVGGDHRPRHRRPPPPGPGLRL